MIFLPIALAIGGCSLFHQDQPNEAPVIEAQADTLRVRRGGSVTLNILASDEDDDPLNYRWVALDGTLEPNKAQAVWTAAPLQVEGASQIVTVYVTVLDRDCDSVEDSRDRDRCETTALATVDSFHIEVVQRAPRLQSITHDGNASFRDPVVTVAAAVTDEDGDSLYFAWSVADTTSTALADAVGEEAGVIPLFPGQHTIRVTVHDRADTVMGTIVLELDEPTVPDGGSVRLEIASTGDTPAHAFEIDVFEYPNQRGAVPVLAESFFEAARICSVAGARLCTGQEWASACSGPEDRSFSSTDDPGQLPAAFGRRFCNTPGSVLNPSTASEDGGVLAASGNFPNCSSGTGVYDLTGNAREWLMDGDSEQVWGQVSPSSAAIDAACDEMVTLAEPVAPTASASDAAYYEPGSGFRCCRDADVGDVGQIDEVGGAGDAADIDQ